MSEIILVTGGARSGKSQYAEALASGGIVSERRPDISDVLYIATAQITDEEMEDRICKHRAQRPEGWKTWERYRDLAEISSADNDFSSDDYGTVLLDDLGNLLMGILYDDIADADTCELSEFDRAEEIVLKEIQTIVDFAHTNNKRLIIVTNEIGLGLVPAYRLSRYYRDILGRANKLAAELADKVVFLVSGIPLNIK